MADWDNPYSTWDDGETWDADGAPITGDVTPYLNLITSEHNQQPDFMAMLTGIFQPLADGLALAQNFPTLFDLDTALGAQLDIIGLWIGRTRQIQVPITGVFFTFNTGPGFNQGILPGPFDPANSVILLPDEQYRTLLRATVAANHWDGTAPGAYAAYAIVFGPGGYTLTITDNQDMTINLTLGGPNPDALTRALFMGGYLNLKPMGVEVANYFVVPT